MEKVINYLTKANKNFDFENDGEGGTIVILEKLYNVEKHNWTNAMLYENGDGTYYLEASNSEQELEKDFKNLKQLNMFLGKYAKGKNN